MADVYTDPPKLMLLPTGAGEPRELSRGNIAYYQFAGFFPDGQHVLFTGNEAGKQSRAYIQDVSGGAPRAVAPEGYSIVFDPSPRMAKPSPRATPLDNLCCVP